MRIGVDASVPLAAEPGTGVRFTAGILYDFPDGKTTQAYGVFNAERMLAQRSYFIVDKQGVIRYKKVLAPKEPLVENETLIAEVKKLK